MRLGGINHWAGTSLHQTHLGRLSFWKDEPSAWTDIFWLQGFDFKLVTLEQQGFGGWHALFQGLNPHYSWLAFLSTPHLLLHDQTAWQTETQRGGWRDHPSALHVCNCWVAGRQERPLPKFLFQCILYICKSNFLINSKHNQDNGGVGSPHF